MAKRSTSSGISSGTSTSSSESLSTASRTPPYAPTNAHCATFPETTLAEDEQVSDEELDLMLQRYSRKNRSDDHNNDKAATSSTTSNHRGAHSDNDDIVDYQSKMKAMAQAFNAPVEDLELDLDAAIQHAARQLQSWELPLNCGSMTSTPSSGTTCTRDVEQEEHDFLERVLQDILQEFSQQDNDRDDATFAANPEGVPATTSSKAHWLDNNNNNNNHNDNDNWLLVGMRDENHRKAMPHPLSSSLYNISRWGVAVCTTTVTIIVIITMGGLLLLFGSTSNSSEGAAMDLPRIPPPFHSDNHTASQLPPPSLSNLVSQAMVRVVADATVLSGSTSCLNPTT